MNNIFTNNIKTIEYDALIIGGGGSGMRASLELAKDGYIDLIQNRSEELFIKSKRSSSFGS